MLVSDPDQFLENIQVVLVGSGIVFSQIARHHQNSQPVGIFKSLNKAPFA